MAQGMNRITLIGNLGKDPELRHTQKDRAVLNFRMATTETYVDKEGEKKENTQWHTCVLWGPRAEGLSKYLAKGSLVCVEGRMEYSEYEDKEGVKRHKSEVNVHNVILLDRSKRDAEDHSDEKTSSARSAPSGKAADKKLAVKKAAAVSSDAGDDDQIPF